MLPEYVFVYDAENLCYFVAFDHKQIAPKERNFLFSNVTSGDI
jgi:hypothetical protein